MINVASKRQRKRERQRERLSCRHEETEVEKD